MRGSDRIGIYRVGVSRVAVQTATHRHRVPNPPLRPRQVENPCCIECNRTPRRSENWRDSWLISETMLKLRIDGTWCPRCWALLHPL
jgi:hypothetical protein